MPTFKITAIKPDKREPLTLLYTTENSTLTTEDYTSVVPRLAGVIPMRASPKMPKGREAPKAIKIQLGLSCNYECEYCSQRFVPHAEETHKKEAELFVANMDTWLKNPPGKIEFWGGEPFVYWKTLKPLAEALRERFPETVFSVITNGSLLTIEINDWLARLDFSVGVSHDGPGQHVRGPDPFDDPETKAAIMDLYRRLAPTGRFSFNSMMNRSNTSRAAVQKFFEDLVGPGLDIHLVIGEGGFVDAYDEGGVAQSLATQGEAIQYRNQAFAEIRTGQVSKFRGGIADKIASFANSMRTARPLDSVGQKCGMDQADTIAVDLHGNVLTCQNVSPVSTNPAGVSHKIGHVSDLAAVELKSGTHWSDRAECPKCPMIHICKGSCLFLSGPLWETSCNNAYADAVPIFAAGIEFLTGYVPIHIEGDFREDRKDIFGMVNGIPKEPKNRVIPIMQG